MSAESSVNAHAEALRLKSRHGIAVSKGIRTAFDAGQQEDLDYRGISIKTPPLKVEIWEFSFRGLNCAKKSRNSASGVLIVPKEILIKS